MRTAKAKLEDVMNDLAWQIAFNARCGAEALRQFNMAPPGQKDAQHWMAFARWLAYRGAARSVFRTLRLSLDPCDLAGLVLRARAVSKYLRESDAKKEAA